MKTIFTKEWTMWLIILYFTNAWISEKNEMWVIVLCFITAWNVETTDNVSEHLMLLDYEFHTVLKYKTITHISFISRSDQKTCSLKRTSNILIWINEDLMPTRREINSAAHFGQINVQHFDPIKWWSHEVQIKEACDIHAWHKMTCCKH